MTMQRHERLTARMLVIAVLVMAACHGSRTVTVVAPPPPPVYPDWQQRTALQNADAAIYQHASAECSRLYEQCYELARMRLDAALEHPHTLPPAVIVDVDETVLDNSAYQVTNIARGRSYTPATWNEWALMGSAKALPGALAFLRYAESRGCEVFYITNREPRERASTLRNLDSLGFPFADEAHLLLMEGSSDKTERRARVRSTHEVVLLVGDQLRDFDERFKDRSVNSGKDIVEAMADSLSRYFVLLPNPMYGTYRDAVQGKGTDAEKLARMRAWFGSEGH